ncbi:hypothetical protein [Streptomyces griseoruber]|uniref:hypothetical protein n=1 Tax=Streptomyces griseoruber TaxID=1943 RepID=UPI0037B23872
MKRSRLAAAAAPIIAAVALMTATPASAETYYGYSGGNAYARGGLRVSSQYLGDGIYHLNIINAVVTDEVKNDGRIPFLKAVYKDYSAGNPTEEKNLGWGDDDGESAYLNDTSFGVKSVTFKVCAYRSTTGTTTCTNLSRG